MIDNRPKTFPKKKQRPAPEKTPILEVIPAEAVHSEAAKEAPPPPPARPVRAKAASPLAGLMGGLGNLGGGGIGGILPVVLVASAMQRGRGTPGGAQARPQVSQSQNLPAVPSQHVATAAAADPPAAPSRPLRPGPSPTQIRGLLGDLSGYLPGAGNASLARVSRIMGIAEDLRTINSAGDMIATSQVTDPMNRNIGLLNALSRNLPMNGASNLGKASQVLSMVNTFKGGGQNLGGLGSLGGLGNMGNMAGMLRGMMSPAPSQDAGPQIKNVTPAQADGIKDTVNRLLSGMDDKQKSELLDKARDFLGKR